LKTELLGLFGAYNHITSLNDGGFLREIQKIYLFLVPSESAPRELSNEWSCQYVSTIVNVLGNFCVLPFVMEVNISP
jgi:hypothetical protein